MPLTRPPRQALLAVKGGCGEGPFVRLEPDGRESEGFGARLRMGDEQGTLEAGLTGPTTGRTAPMIATRKSNGHEAEALNRWAPKADRVLTILPADPGQGPVPVTLGWRPEPGLSRRIACHCCPCGPLEPLPPD